MSTKNIDFIVIGAQKSGTTTLYELLKKHPNIYLPASKEAPFFNNEEYIEKGVEKFIDDHYPKNKGYGEIWGKISPQYMSNKEITERVAKSLPSTKLICILRDPIKRAVSHYQMSVRRGLEDREINKAFADSLHPNALEAARLLPSHKESENKCYIAWSEYSRIIEQYKSNNKNVLTTYFEDLKNNPGEYLRTLLEHLNVDANYKPSILGKQAFKGESSSIFKQIKKIKKIKAAELIWESIPEKYRSYIYFKTEQISDQITPGILKKEINLNLSDELILELAKTFNEDIEKYGIIEKHKEWSF